MRITYRRKDLKNHVGFFSVIVVVSTVADKASERYSRCLKI